ncbi:DUF4252 domain-containing protein [uncultured Gelidibacter sp.]|uniref:DUF4252 domain-containing protein n=1 Tax=uncultured Gelidibacter sp. TaxID=259318 RepID=UPI002625AED1|nr:DUF4252 domain-containing protein [uncultured Gelidibacter sp.]
MTAIMKNMTVMVLLIATVFSCNQGPSLQTYFVDNQEKANFLAVDVPLSMLNIDKMQLTDDQRDAYESIQKLNMLAYKMKPDNVIEYQEKLVEVTAILSDPKYEELMRGGNPEEGQFIVKFLGDEDDVEEFIVFGNIDGKGFAVVRVVGNDMNPGKIVTLASALDKSTIDDSQLSQFKEFFK